MAWVKFLGLPLEFWMRRAVMDTGNFILHFIYMNHVCGGTQDKQVAWILVELQYFKGLPENIEIAWDLIWLRQRLDYWGIPFKCLLCHHMIHLLNQFPRGQSTYVDDSLGRVGHGHSTWNPSDKWFLPNDKGIVSFLVITM